MRIFPNIPSVISRYHSEIAAYYMYKNAYTAYFFSNYALNAHRKQKTAAFQPRFFQNQPTITATGMRVADTYSPAASYTVAVAMPS